MIDRLKRSAFELAGRAGSCSIRDTIVLAGSPRSGTTWLLELFRRLPGYKALQEPLMYEDARQRHGFSWRTHMAPGEHRPRERAYLENILTGQWGISPAWFFEAEGRPAQLVEHATRRKLIVKFCRAGRMLPWMCQQFDVRGTVLLIRHPCAVVASMLRHGGWEKDKLHDDDVQWKEAFKGQDIPEPLRERVASVLDDISSRVEVLALTWCLDYYVPLRLHVEAAHHPWILVPYERMVTQGASELERIAASLGVEVTPAMHTQMEEPSSSVRDRLRRDARDQLAKWRNRLSPAQATNVLRVVEAFDLDFYTDDLHPDYDRLMQFQRDDAQVSLPSNAA